jgi:hypothetical protein
MTLVCGICGGLAIGHTTEVHNGANIEHWFCVNHAPPEIAAARIKLPFPLNLPESAAEEIPYLRELLARIDEVVFDAVERADTEARIKRLIGEIQAGGRWLGDAH